MLTLDHVSFTYGDHTALSDITYQFELGKCYCIEGPNGSGKSTLFRILNGLSFPTAGTYSIEEQPVNAKTMKNPAFAKNLHRRIGFIFQNSEVQLFCKTVEDEIAFGLFQLGYGESEVRSRTDRYIEALGLEELRSRAPFSLSGGEQKRTALAAVLAMEPQVLILDEPVSGLDEDGEQRMIKFLNQQKKPDRMLIVATHRHELSEMIADKILKMNKQHRLII